MKWLPGIWTLPAGKVEPGEDLAKSVIRELKEETNLDGEIISSLPPAEFIGTLNGVLVHNVQINYLIAFYHDRVKINNECEAFKWVKLSGYESSLLDNYNKRTIRLSLPVIKNTLT